MGLTLLFPNHSGFLLPARVKTSSQSLSGCRYADQRDASIAGKVSPIGSAELVCGCALNDKSCSKPERAREVEALTCTGFFRLRKDLAPHQFPDPS